MRYRLCLLLLLALACPARADKLLLETYQAAYFEGLKVGHLHLAFRQTGTGDGARIASQQSMTLLIKRYGSVMAISQEETSEETTGGKVQALGLTFQIGK